MRSSWRRRPEMGGVAWPTPCGALRTSGPCLLDCALLPFHWTAGASASRQAVPAAGSGFRGRRLRRRLPCAARFGVAPPNSLRSLRSLRSDTGGESDVEARTACAPTPKLRCSALHYSPGAGTAWRESHRRWCANKWNATVVSRSRVGAVGCPHAASLRRCQRTRTTQRHQRPQLTAVQTQPPMAHLRTSACRRRRAARRR